MQSEKQQFLSLKVLPARLPKQETAWYLGFEPHNIVTLVGVKMLKPLGNPADNGTKYFAAIELERLRADLRWLDRATDAIYRGWHEKNLKAKRRNGLARPNGLGEELVLSMTRK